MRTRLLRFLVWLRWPALVCAVVLAAQARYLGSKAWEVSLDLGLPVHWRCDAGNVGVMVGHRLTESNWHWSAVRLGTDQDTEGQDPTFTAWKGWVWANPQMVVAATSASGVLQPVRFTMTAVRFPTWPVCIGLVAFAAAAHGVRRLLRARPGQCAVCGYALPKSGMCPECGKAAVSGKAAARVKAAG